MKTALALLLCFSAALLAGPVVTTTSTGPAACTLSPPAPSPLGDIILVPPGPVTTYYAVAQYTDLFLGPQDNAPSTCSVNVSDELEIPGSGQGYILIAQNGSADGSGGAGPLAFANATVAGDGISYHDTCGDSCQNDVTIPVEFGVPFTVTLNAGAWLSADLGNNSFQGGFGGTELVLEASDSPFFLNTSCCAPGPIYITATSLLPITEVTAPEPGTWALMLVVPLVWGLLFGGQRDLKPDSKNGDYSMICV